MCFSATASLVTSAALIPLGLLTIRQLPDKYSPYRAFAAFPLLFGMQQALEAMVWLDLSGEAAVPGQLAALGFLFFVYLIWPLLVPLSAWLVEQNRLRRQLFGAMAGVGALFGAAMFTPLLMNDGWFDAEITSGSIHYRVVSVFDGVVPDSAFGAVYSALVILPLLLSGASGIRTFGVTVFASSVVSVLLYYHALTSVWCFFAALLSVQVFWIVRERVATAAAVPTASART